MTDERKYEIQEDDFTGLDDGLAGTNEDAYDGDYTVEQIKVGGKTVNKRIGVFTQKSEQDKVIDGDIPSLQEKLDDADRRYKEQFIDYKEKQEEYTREL